MGFMIRPAGVERSTDGHDRIYDRQRDRIQAGDQKRRRDYQTYLLLRAGRTDDQDGDVAAVVADAGKEYEIIQY